MVETAKRTDSLRDITRKAAERQVSSVQGASRSLRRYAESLRRYADGETGGLELGKEAANLAVDQWTRSTEDAVEVAADYYRWLWSLAGVEARTAGDEQDDSGEDAGRTEAD